MGCCVSTDIRLREKEKSVSSSYQGLGLCNGKRSSRTFSDHVSTLQQLSSIPNRIVQNGKSRSSCVFTQQGRKGINQDAMIVWEDFMPNDMTFLGVFDGHGPHGHLVARKVRDVLPLKLISFINSCELKQTGSSSICCSGDFSSDRGDLENDIPSDEKGSSLWREAFLKTYKAMDKELKSHPNLDCFCSGSTSVTIIKQGSNLYIGSIGDSRAIMGSKDNNDSMMATQLTVDLKPDLPREAERIKRCKGRVFAMQDEPEVSRVWLPFDDAPGLAMARAFGDFCLKEYGVISIPEFYHQTITKRDKFIVLASDGVWDVLSNEEVVELVSSSSTRALASRSIVESAAREWKTKYPTSKMDDCAVICLFLDGKVDSESDYDEQGFSSATNHSNHSIESDDGQNPEPSFQRNFTVRSYGENENCTIISLKGDVDGASVVDEQDWSGLEGVTRVNSLVQLPRFSQETPRD